jgi:hypothetical protein
MRMAARRRVKMERAAPERVRMRNSGEMGEWASRERR